jgi:nicotinate-nucleotide adenylyltransferase
VWWLVSPQNPLKPGDGMAPLANRLADARATTRSPRIRALDLETRLGTRYTIDTVTAMRRLFPRTRFVWLMGADNLRQIRRWRRWREIFRRVPIAVLDRPTYSRGALGDLAARAFARRRVPPGAARRLADMPPPAWTFLPIKLDRRSASAIRQEKARRR